MYILGWNTSFCGWIFIKFLRGWARNQIFVCVVDSWSWSMNFSLRKDTCSQSPVVHMFSRGMTIVILCIGQWTIVIYSVKGCLSCFVGEWVMDCFYSVVARRLNDTEILSLKTCTSTLSASMLVLVMSSCYLALCTWNLVGNNSTSLHLLEICVWREVSNRFWMILCHRIWNILVLWLLITILFESVADVPSDLLECLFCLPISYHWFTHI